MVNKDVLLSYLNHSSIERVVFCVLTRNKIIMKEGLTMNKMMRLFKEEDGQGMTEYALIIAGVSIALIVVLGLFKEQIKTVFNNIIAGFTTAQG